MCNIAHKTRADTLVVSASFTRGWNPRFRKIKPEGIGYKIFRTRSWTLEPQVNVLRPMCGGVYKDYSETPLIVTINYDSWINWIERFYNNNKEYGFCFFATQKEAESARRFEGIFSGTCITKKIAYKGGIGSFYSIELDGKMRRFRLATSFKILD